MLVKYKTLCFLSQVVVGGPRAAGTGVGVVDARASRGGVQADGAVRNGGCGTGVAVDAAATPSRHVVPDAAVDEAGIGVVTDDLDAAAISGDVVGDDVVDEVCAGLGDVDSTTGCCAVIG